MITIAEVKKARNRAPFRKFNLHLKSGEVLPVEHGDTLSINPQVDDLFFLWVGPEWHLVDVSYIARITVIKK